MPLMSHLQPVLIRRPLRAPSVAPALIGCLLVLLLAGCVTPVEGNPGLFLPSSEGTPPAVQAAADSVYRVIVFPETHRQLVARNEVPQLLESWREAKAAGEISATGLYCLEVLGNALASGPSESANLGVTATGTAFLHEDRRTIWTNRHVVAPLGDLAPGMVARIVVIDSRDRIVFDGRAGRGTATIHAVGRPDEERLKSVKDEGTRHLASDYALLSLDRDLPGRPLPVRHADIPVGTPLFVIGYPGLGTGREVGGDPNALQLRYGRGELVIPERHRLRDEDRSVDMDAPGYRQHMITTTADVESGMSGSPILDSDGRVVAIACGALIGGSSSAAAGLRSILLSPPGDASEARPELP